MTNGDKWEQVEDITYQLIAQRSFPKNCIKIDADGLIWFKSPVSGMTVFEVLTYAHIAATIKARPKIVITIEAVVEILKDVEVWDADTIQSLLIFHSLD